MLALNRLVQKVAEAGDRLLCPDTRWTADEPCIAFLPPLLDLRCGAAAVRFGLPVSLPCFPPFPNEPLTKTLVPGQQVVQAQLETSHRMEGSQLSI